MRKDRDGAVFVDRSPDLFVPLLDFLRTGRLTLRGLEEDAVRAEAEFYGINLPALVEPRRRAYGYVLLEYNRQHPNNSKVSRSGNVPAFPGFEEKGERKRIWSGIRKFLWAVQDAGWTIDATNSKISSDTISIMWLVSKPVRNRNEDDGNE